MTGSVPTGQYAQQYITTTNQPQYITTTTTNQPQYVSSVQPQYISGAQYNTQYVSGGGKISASQVNTTANLGSFNSATTKRAAAEKI